MSILFDHMKLDEDMLPDKVEDVITPPSFDYNNYVSDITCLYEDYKHCLVKNDPPKAREETMSCEKQTMNSDCESFLCILKETLNGTHHAKKTVSPGLVFQLVENHSKSSHTWMLTDVIDFIMQVETLSFDIPVLQELDFYQFNQQAREEESITELTSEEFIQIQGKSADVPLVQATPPKITPAPLAPTLSPKTPASVPVPAPQAVTAAPEQESQPYDDNEDIDSDSEDTVETSGEVRTQRQIVVNKAPNPSSSNKKTASKGKNKNNRKKTKGAKKAASKTEQSSSSSNDANTNSAKSGDSGSKGSKKAASKTEQSSSSSNDANTNSAKSGDSGSKGSKKAASKTEQSSSSSSDANTNSANSGDSGSRRSSKRIAETQLTNSNSKAAKKSTKVEFDSDTDTEEEASSSSAAGSRVSSRMKELRETTQKIVFPHLATEDVTDSVTKKAPMAKKTYEARQRVTLPDKTGRKRIPFSFEEEEAILAGYDKWGPQNWEQIRTDPEFSEILKARTNVDLKDKFRNLLKKGAVP